MTFDCLRPLKTLDELVFHLLGVDKDVIGDPILIFRDEAISAASRSSSRLPALTLCAVNAIFLLRGGNKS